MAARHYGRMKARPVLPLPSISDTRYLRPQPCIKSCSSGAEFRIEIHTLLWCACLRSGLSMLDPADMNGQRLNSKAGPCGYLQCRSAYVTVHCSVFPGRRDRNKGDGIAHRPSAAAHCTTLHDRLLSTARTQHTTQ